MQHCTSKIRKFWIASENHVVVARYDAERIRGENQQVTKNPND